MALFIKASVTEPVLIRSPFSPVNLEIETHPHLRQFGQRDRNGQQIIVVGGPLQLLCTSSTGSITPSCSICR